MPSDDSAADAAGSPRICEVGGSGLLLPLLGENEQEWPRTVRGILYFVGLAWCFLGVSIIADIFMAAIEAITSRKVSKKLESGQVIVVRWWNPTVSNLTLMALGSSAPEILLSVIEIMGNGFYSGELGPSTIVGSAAFNLLVIVAVCVYVVPVGETRTVRQLGPFIVTSFFSVFAYVWLVVILAIHSTDKVDVWEGLMTFAFFPVLVFVSYLADVGALPGTGSGESFEEVQERAMEAGYKLTAKEARLLTYRLSTVPKSRAQHRVENGVTTQLAGGKISSKDLRVGFVCSKYQYNATCQSLLCELEMQGPAADDARVGIEVATMDGTMVAAAGHYSRLTAHFVELNPQSPSTVVRITRFQGSPLPKAEESTFDVRIVRAVKLKAAEALDWEQGLQEQIEEASERSAVPLCPHLAATTISVSTDLGIGQLGVDNQDMVVTVGDQDTEIKVKVVRMGGCEGTLSCRYATESDTAMSGYDFVATEGELVFSHGVSEAYVPIQVCANKMWEGTERFFVVLTEVKEGSAALQSGRTHCSITILSSFSPTGIASKVLYSLNRAHNLDSMTEGTELWREQLLDAFRPGSSDDISEASALDWAFFVVALPWKVFFALVPPPTYCRGWLCFVVALIFIGVVTAVIGDMAALLGCVAGIPDSITAITFVALGTSLPDTFASMTAAVDDASADNALGNVTGSNAVNVFLGLGLPWMIASIYWNGEGATEAWKLKYPKQASQYPGGGFIVVAGDLVFSVLIFTICACVALGVIFYRRRQFEAELGGPVGVKTSTSVLFVCLWGYYVGLASWKTLAGDVSASQMVVAAITGFFIVSFTMVVVVFVAYLANSLRQAKQDVLKDLLTKAGVGKACVDKYGPLTEVLAQVAQDMHSVRQTLSAIESQAAMEYARHQERARPASFHGGQAGADSRGAAGCFQEELVGPSVSMQCSLKVFSSKALE
eukprot:TRINITY_DN59578_c0_g1_i1.p1 TRINITY_DN59578_c0_g1~~TRINITY_DN59578_c0_g1_i1.p1  ORF type:complete len:948 (+),score=195.04 TRINITY_DN59578_c0_g1_i1:130-2973(+)